MEKIKENFSTHLSSMGENNLGYNQVSSWIEFVHYPSGKKSFFHQEQKQKMPTDWKRQYIYPGLALQYLESNLPAKENLRSI